MAVPHLKTMFTALDISNLGFIELSQLESGAKMMEKHQYNRLLNETRRHGRIYYEGKWTN